jgi:hypothetical protein
MELNHYDFTKFTYKKFFYCMINMFAGIVTGKLGF